LVQSTQEAEFAALCLGVCDVTRGGRDLLERRVDFRECDRVHVPVSPVHVHYRRFLDQPIWAAMARGEAEEAEAMFGTGMRVGEELGAVWHLPMYQAGLAALHSHMGRWDEALVEAETALTIGEELGTRLGMVACTAVAALIRAQRDDLMDAERLLALARSEIDREGPQWGSYWTILASAEIAEAHGDHAAALAELRDDWAALAGSPGLQVSLATALVRRARGRARAGTVGRGHGRVARERWTSRAPGAVRCCAAAS
jgi:ATP/maltotriose-dependent transcriptional regulator MalT